MLLNDIGRVPATTFKKINQHLQSNYGFKITEDAKDQDLVSIMETIKDEISELKMQGNDAKASPEISKRLLVLEGIKTLREYAMVQFQSPKLESVINGMVEFIVDSFHHSGTNMSDFEEAVKDAMKVYRSSKYRFPDDYVEQRVRSAAMSKLETPEDSSMTPMMEDNYWDKRDPDTTPSEWDDGEDEDETDGSELDENATVPFTKEDYLSRKKTLQRLLMDPTTSKNPETKAEVTKKWHLLKKQAEHAGYEHPEMAEETKIDKTPVLAVHGISSKNLKQGNAMREHTNLVKNLRRLLETEVSQAEVMMAAKGFAEELQEMVEKIGRLQNEDLPPVTDQMRETYGNDSSSSFQTQIYSAFQGVMDALYTAKNQVDDAVSNMAQTGQVGAATDMDKDMGMDAGMDAGAAPEDMEPELDLDNIGDEMGDVEDEMGDEFGGAEEEEPLGRAMKESALQRKVMEMKKLVNKARKLKEARK